MNEIKILFIQKSRDYCASIVQMLSSDGITVHPEYIPDASYVDTLSRCEWNVIVGDESLLRQGSPDIDSFMGFLSNPLGNIPLIVVTNHEMGSAHFVTMSSFPGIAANNSVESMASTIISMFKSHETFDKSQVSMKAPEQSQAEEKALVCRNELGLANRRLLAEIHERRKAEIALKRSEEQLRLAYEELEKRVQERTAELARSDKESRELYSLLDKMFSTTNMLIAYLDTDLRYVSVNKAFAEVNNQKPAYFTGKHYLDLCPIAEHEQVFRNVIETGKSYNAYEQPFEFPALVSSSPVYWDWYVEPSFDENRKVDGIMIGLMNVTDRVHSQSELKINEQRLADAQRMAHMGSWIYDIEKHTMMCSDEFFRIFGLKKRKNLPLEKLIDRIHPDDRERLMNEARQALNERKSYHSEHRIVLPGGDIRVAEMQFEVISEGDKPKTVRGVTHDITTLRRAEQSRKESEAHLRSFIDSATDSFLLFDKDFNLIEINANAAEFMGDKREKLLGRNILDIMPDTEKNGQYALYKRVLETGEPVYFDNFIGESGPGSRYYYQQAFRAGEDLGIIFTEITDRKQYENTLLHKQHQLELMLKRETLLSWVASRLNSPGSFQIVAKDLLHTLTTELHLGMAAAWPEQAPDQFIEVDIKTESPVFSDKLIMHIHALQSQRAPDRRMIVHDIDDLPEKERRHFNGSRIRSIALFPAAIAARTVGYLCFCDVKRHAWHDEELYLLGTAADIIASAWERQNQMKARAEAEQQRIEALQMTEKVSRMASIGEIAGGITHEINQPLTAIKVSADSIRFWNRNNRNVLPEKFITMVDKISLSVDRISEIVRHMRSFWVAPNLVEHTALDLNTVVERALSLLNRQLHSHRIKPVVELSEEELVITGNPIHLEQILINLVVNSMYALDTADRRDKYVKIKTRKENGRAVLSVIDNGIGLPEEAGNKIYDPFYSTRKPGEGTGKEIIARLVHYGRGGVTAPFVSINCSSISPSLFESELFGYEGGAFTGANKGGMKGKLELAQGGSLFLDEIGDMPMEMQPKLLRALQEREIYRVGGLKKITLDVRIICATNRNLARLVEQNLFRQDLFYRLNMGRITIPTLTSRSEEIAPLAQMFLERFASEKKRRFRFLSKDAVKTLERHDWPGNVRELQNSIERVVLLYDDIEVRPEHLAFLSDNGDAVGAIGSPLTPGSIVLPDEGIDLDALEAEIVRKALDRFDGNKSQTAAFLGLTRSSLRSRLKKL